MNLDQMGNLAVEAKYEVQALTTKQKNDALHVVAKALIEHAKELLAANEKDLARAKENGMHEGLVDRLRLTDARIEDMAEGIRQVADLPDPVGEVIEAFTQKDGLQLKKVRVPIGVIGIIYESRPNVTADAFSLCFKSGNAVILKGGSDAIESNIAITQAIRGGLKEAGVTENAIQLIEDTNRETTNAFMKCNHFVDVLIPRGGAGLIRAVVNQSTIPVIETGTGNCHIYVDEFADIDKAIPIIVNAKTQRIGVCNAAESLIVHEKIYKEFLPKLKEAMDAGKVEIRGDEKTCEILTDMTAATEEDFGREYLDYIISCKVVADLDEAIRHINKYNTGHSDAIITEDANRAQKFLDYVDSACVYHNASTRFTDGFQFGFGAEIGISTQKLHARGPMGLKELTSYKYQITGDGQVRK
ncbi:MAG: glutamate-5-semialdehyde dehydrogenase [Lachnospiraceae bacterium]|nr:glutamate-5-semialdehyde dehydrogenase [Lachnospiraceae bacterium]